MAVAERQRQSLTRTRNEPQQGSGRRALAPGQGTRHAGQHRRPRAGVGDPAQGRPRIVLDHGAGGAGSRARAAAPGCREDRARPGGRDERDRRADGGEAARCAWECTWQRGQRRQCAPRMPPRVPGCSRRERRAAAAAGPPPGPAAAPGGRAAHRADRRHQAHDRGRLRQGRRRQVDDGGQPGARPAGDRAQGRHPRCRHLRAVPAAPAGPLRAARRWRTARR